MMKLKCPYCKIGVDDVDDDLAYDITHEWECPECGKTFQFRVEYQPFYTSWKTPCLNDEAEHDYEKITGDFAEIFSKFRRCKICGTIT